MLNHTCFTWKKHWEGCDPVNTPFVLITEPQIFSVLIELYVDSMFDEADNKRDVFIGDSRIKNIPPIIFIMSRLNHQFF